MIQLRRFAQALVLWATGIFLLLVAVNALAGAPPTMESLVRYLARAIVLAAYPAGISAFDWTLPAVSARDVLVFGVAATGVGLLVLAILGVLLPLFDGDAHSMIDLWRTMSQAGNAWESRNDASWNLVMRCAAGATAVLYALIGLQVGIWTRQALPRGARRLACWAIGLGLLFSAIAISDTLYETLVLHTDSDTRFGALITLLVPGSLCAGLALPTLTVLRRGLPSE